MEEKQNQLLAGSVYQVHKLLLCLSCPRLETTCSKSVSHLHLIREFILEVNEK